MSLKGVPYAKGLGTHSTTKLVYNIGGQYSQFLADLGIDDEETGNPAYVDMQVLGDGKLLYDSGLILTTSATQHIDVKVAGVQQLTLLVNDPGEGTAHASADCGPVPDSTEPRRKDPRESHRQLHVPRTDGCRDLAPPPEGLWLDITLALLKRLRLPHQSNRTGRGRGCDPGPPVRVPGQGSGCSGGAASAAGAWGFFRVVFLTNPLDWRSKVTRTVPWMVSASATTPLSSRAASRHGRPRTGPSCRQASGCRPGRATGRRTARARRAWCRSPRPPGDGDASARSGPSTTTSTAGQLRDVGSAGCRGEPEQRDRQHAQGD